MPPCFRQKETAKTWHMGPKGTDLKHLAPHVRDVRGARCDTPRRLAHGLAQHATSPSTRARRGTGPPRRKRARAAFAIYRASCAKSTRPLDAFLGKRRPEAVLPCGVNQRFSRLLNAAEEVAGGGIGSFGEGIAVVLGNGERAFHPGNSLIGFFPVHKRGVNHE